MEYNKIIAVTGLPGLYELLSSKADGAIVRSLDDKSTRFVANRVHNFSHLESIEVYTIRDNVNLVDILKAMESSSEKLPEGKDNSALKAYFTKVFPDLDFERVYTSDLKKMVKWFIVLKNNNVEIKLSEAPAEELAGDEPGAGEAGEAVAAEAVAAPAKKKASAPKETPPAAAKEATAKAAGKEPAAAEEKATAKKPAPKKKAAPEEKAEKAADKKATPAAEKPKKAAKKK
jgi:uncharacterized protein DUF6852/uncharacterized protein DUF5606